MDELTLKARILYIELEALTTLDEVVTLSTEYDHDATETFGWFIKAMLFKIALADGVVCDKEVAFINTVVGEDDNNALLITSIMETSEETINGVLEAVPLLIILAAINVEMAYEAIEKIQTIAICLIAIDNNNDEREISTLASIITPLTQSIDNSSQNKNSNKSIIPKIHTISDEDEELSLDLLLEELNILIGLDAVKKDVLSLTNLVKVRQLRLSHDMPIPPMSFHLVFSGNPGTGKTTVARLLSKIYKALGLLSKGHLIEVDRSSLVAGYVGQTAIKVSEVITEALGGILFIDEAYSLTSNQDSSDYGGEAIDTILKAMEDNRDDLIIIVAGYPDKMDSFLQSNPGLKSRFNKFVHFSDYNSEEMLNIFLSLCKNSGYIVTKDARQLLAKLVVFLDKNRGDNFGNGREIRNKFEIVLQHQANRVMSTSNPTKEDLQAITASDISPLVPI